METTFKTTQDFSRLRALTAAGKATGAELIDMNESDYAACQKGKQELATLCTPATVIALLDALDALQAEVKHLNLHLKATQSGRDAALARLAELAKQEPVIYQAKTKPGFLSTSAYAWEDCEKADFLVYEADGVQVRGLYLAAGASPQQSPLLQFCTCEDCKPMECEGCRINRERRELLPAPDEAAREYMTGYSDGREWAGATNQALVGALKDATQSLETISMLAGRKTYGNPPLETFMETFSAVRGYAISRAGVGREAIAAINAKEKS